MRELIMMFLMGSLVGLACITADYSDNNGISTGGFYESSR
jgi:hypothetical protein